MTAAPALAPHQKLQAALKRFDVPTLVMHGEDDQIVPVKDSARKSAKLIASLRFLGSEQLVNNSLPNTM